MHPVWNTYMNLAESAGQWFLQPLSVDNLSAAAMRDLTFSSVLLRLTLSVLLGGIIGLERAKKNCPAGFRTYMLVCMGSALAMLLGQYITVLSASRGVSSDMTRIGAQVINGIGFLGAGTILLTQKQQVKGLTTAAALWASACMGLALGAAFYECVLLAFSAILIVILLLPKVESYLVEKSRNMDIYVEAFAADGIHQVIDCLRRQNIHIYDVDISHSNLRPEGRPSAVFSIRLNRKQTHTSVIKQLSLLDAIYSIQEL